MLAITQEAEVAKGGTAPGAVGGFEYHRIDDVEAATKPLFVKHGVLAVPTVAECHFDNAGGWNVATVRLEIAFINANNPEDRQVISSWGQGLDKQDKAIGEAISYACKNAYLSIFHLKGKPDPEADAHEDHVPAVPRLDTAEVVPFGKNRGTAWNELNLRQLSWYAANTRHPEAAAAAKEELKRREVIQ